MTASLIAIIGGKIVDGTGGPAIGDGLVLIENGKISYAGPKGGHVVPPDAQLIDAAGASVLPGLMDVHVHISLNGPANIQAELMSRPLGQVAYEVARNLRDTIAGGTT